MAVRYKKLGGVTFDLMLFLAIMKDIADLFVGMFALFIAVVPGSSTMIGAAIGKGSGDGWFTSTFGALIGGAVGYFVPGIGTAMGVALGMMTFMMDLLIHGLIFGFLFMNRVSFTTKKLASLGTYFIIELLPILGALVPATTFSLLRIRHLENKDRKEKAKRKQGLNLASAH